jgi:hypothetical protein
MEIEYEKLREKYRPEHIKWLFIAESPPPKKLIHSTRYFYLPDYDPKLGEEDRLFSNTIRALYPEADKLSKEELQAEKEKWLRRFQADGCYLIEASPVSFPHRFKPRERQEKLKEYFPWLLERVESLAEEDTRIILIKSNVFIVVEGKLKMRGYKVINDGNLTYPGVWQEQVYRTKLKELMSASGWAS